MLSICLCHDLVSTLRKPFSNHESRSNFYKIICVLVGLFATAVYMIESEDLINPLSSENRKPALVFMFILYIVNGLAFVYSVIVAWNKMCRKDVFGKEVRSKVMIRHIVFMSAFSLINVYPFMNTFIIFKDW